MGSGIGSGKPASCLSPNSAHNISCSDELLYDAKIHPEQYSNTLSDTQITRLFKSIKYICTFAVENLADSSKFPEDWLFKHRWGKGKKDSPSVLPNGKKFVYMTVGGRTSCVVPSVQKKTGPVAGDVKAEPAEDADGEMEETKPQKRKSKSKPAEQSELEADAEEKRPAKRKRGPAKEIESEVKAVNGDVSSKDNDVKQTVDKKSKSSTKTASKEPDAPNGVESDTKNKDHGRRRSARVSGR